MQFVVFPLRDKAPSNALDFQELPVLSYLTDSGTVFCLTSLRDGCGLAV